MGSVSETGSSVPDVAIVGGGPSGLSFAAILERAGISYVVYEKYAHDSVPIGGSLEMVEGSGQWAMEEAGVYDFRDYGRLGEGTVHRLWDHHGNHVATFGVGRDAPELDRFQIKKALLTKVPDEKIRWSTGVTKAERDASGKIVLHLTDGTTATGFKLVVGADGTWSKVRPLITSANAKYAGIIYLTGSITKDNALYSKTYEMAKEGPMVVMGRGTSIWNQMQGDGHYRVDLGVCRPEDFTTSGRFDIHDTEAVKAVLLSDEFFGRHTADIKEIIGAVEGPIRPWHLHYMPPEELKWSPSEDVTLIGDAAHTTTPFVGEGANSAMRDAVVLANALKEFGFGKKAIAEYEKDMLPYAKDVIERSVESGNLFFDSPAAWVEGVRKNSVVKDLGFVD